MDCADHLEHRVTSAYNVLHGPPTSHARYAYNLPNRFMKSELHDPPIPKEQREMTTAPWTYNSRNRRKLKVLCRFTSDKAV